MKTLALPALEVNTPCETTETCSSKVPPTEIMYCIERVVDRIRVIPNLVRHDLRDDGHEMHKAIIDLEELKKRL